MSDSTRCGSAPEAEEVTAGDRGESSIQMAIVFPIVLLVTICVVQAAMWFFARNIALTAAREGVAAARVYQSPEGAGAARARETLGRIAGDSLTGTTVSTSGSSATEVRVTVTGHAPSMIPGIAGLSVSQSAGAPRERWTTP
ncbi:TadE/TadG family type IV pilus assembly protein [Streptomyces sp. NPDC060010]|uniref:TadE/TadG family type IV pilus assembly protein n=1 Tax=Streptomyces sp. NPDC060010 TaxID=3347036 RepID=UPI003673ACE0